MSALIYEGGHIVAPIRFTDVKLTLKGEVIGY